MNLKLNNVDIDLSFLPEDVREQASEAITSGWEAAITGLKSKNSDLIQQNKDLKEQARSTSDGNTAEAAIRLSEAQDQINALKNDLQIAEHNAKQMQTKLDSAEKTAVEVGEKHDTLVKTTALTEQLTKAGVSDPHLLPAARALLLSDVSLGDDGTPLMGEQALAEALGTWAESDAGKAFVSAGGNAGANAENNGSGNGHAGPNPWKAETRNFTEQSRISSENAELAKQLQAEAGNTNIPTPITQTEQVA